MQKVKSLISILLCCVATITMFGCDSPLQFSSSQNKSHGIAQIKITTTASSPFHLIARTSNCKISASDMDIMVKNLTVTATSVEGLITQIPSGPNRLFEVSVYDSEKVLCYYGSNHADIVADSTAQVTITLYRIGGNAIINGSISENPAPSDKTSPVVPSGLVVYYPFNGNAADESDHGFNGTVNSATLTTDRFGHANKAYYFSGSGGISSTVNTTLSLTVFTVAAWFKSDGSGSTIPRIVAVTPPGECNCYYGLLQANGEWNGTYDTSRRLVGMLKYPSGYGYTLNYSQGTPDSTLWHHGAMTYCNGVLKLYIDGALDRSIPVLAPSTQFSTSASLEIGFCTAGSNYIGKLDDVRIYNRELSENEIMTIYSSSN
jgi:hypothetical protein